MLNWLIDANKATTASNASQTTTAPSKPVGTGRVKNMRKQYEELSQEFQQLRVENRKLKTYLDHLQTEYGESKQLGIENFPIK